MDAYLLVEDLNEDWDWTPHDFYGRPYTDPIPYIGHSGTIFRTPEDACRYLVWSSYDNKYFSISAYSLIKMDTGEDLSHLLGEALEAFEKEMRE